MNAKKEYIISDAEILASYSSGTRYCQPVGNFPIVTLKHLSLNKLFFWRAVNNSLNLTRGLPMTFCHSPETIEKHSGAVAIGY